MAGWEIWIVFYHYFKPFIRASSEKQLFLVERWQLVVQTKVKLQNNFNITLVRFHGLIQTKVLQKFSTRARINWTW